MAQIPNDDDLLLGENLDVVNNATILHAHRTKQLDEAVKEGNWDQILTTCPVRESNALELITMSLGFRKREDYQKAVRHLITEDADELQFVRSLFEDLCDKVLN